MKKRDNTLLLILGAAVIGGGVYVYYMPGPPETFKDSKGRTWMYGPPDKKVKAFGGVYGGNGVFDLIYPDGIGASGHATMEAMKATAEKWITP